MTLPMAEGPRDGDFARYVEQLTGGAPQAGLPPPAPGATDTGTGKVARPAAPVSRRSVKATGPAAAKGGSEGAGSAAAWFKLQAAVAAAMVGLTLVFMPRLIAAALVFAGALLVSAVIRWIGARKGL